MNSYKNLFLILISDIDLNGLESFVSSFSNDTKTENEISSVEDRQTDRHTHTHIYYRRI